ncbi:MAG TPA: Crp/Fnr family transcriptional regulator [Clostridiales bacterium]|nr:Crp/Fnr family transcriptional regulator [Clostridiales bacterium]
MKLIKLIKKSRLFENLTEQEINLIFDCLKGRIVKYSVGQLLASQNEKVEEIGIILEGSALKVVKRFDGTNEPLELLEAGYMFGEIEGYSKDKIFSYSVLANEPGATVLYISIETIVRQCSKNCEFHQRVMENVMEILADKNLELSRDKNYLMEKGMRAKIAMFFYEKYREQNSLEIKLGINRNEMAEYLNVSRPSMSREMGVMKDEGIIDYWKDEIKILNLGALEEIVKNANF